MRVSGGAINGPLGVSAAAFAVPGDVDGDGLGELPGTGGTSTGDGVPDKVGCSPRAIVSESLPLIFCQRSRERSANCCAFSAPKTPETFAAALSPAAVVVAAS